MHNVPAGEKAGASNIRLISDLVQTNSVGYGQWYQLDQYKRYFQFVKDMLLEVIISEPLMHSGY